MFYISRSYYEYEASKIKDEAIFFDKDDNSIYSINQKSKSK